MSQDNFQDQEISLTEIVGRLWRGRGLALLGAVIGVFLGVAIVMFLSAGRSSSMEYYISLIDIEDGQYPNGTEFSPQDLLSPTIISQLMSEIPSLSANELRAAVTVENNSPKTAGIVKRYQALLSQRGISATEIATINEQFLTELEAATESGLRISLSTTDLNLSDSQARDVLTRLPQIWSEAFSVRFETVRDPNLQPVQPLDVAGDPDVIEVTRALNKVGLGLKVLESDNRLRALQTASGTTPSSLLSDWQFLRETALVSVFLTDDPRDETTKIAYLRNLRLDVTEIEELLDGVEGAIETITTVMTSSGAPTENFGQNQDDLKLDGTIFTSIIDLTNRAALADDLRELTEKQQELVAELATARRELNLFGGSGGAGQGDISVLVNQSNVLIAAYQEVYQVANAIYQNEYPTYYEAVAAPRKTAVRSSLQFLQILIGLVFLFTLIGLIVGFFRAGPSETA